MHQLKPHTQKSEVVEHILTKQNYLFPFVFQKQTTFPVTRTNPLNPFKKFRCFTCDHRPNPIFVLPSCLAVPGTCSWGKRWFFFLREPPVKVGCQKFWPRNFTKTHQNLPGNWWLFLWSKSWCPTTWHKWNFENLEFPLLKVGTFTHESWRCSASRGLAVRGCIISYHAISGHI